MRTCLLQTAVTCLSLLLVGRADATLVRLDFSIGSQAQAPVFIELYDQDAPATVANFLNYIDNGAGLNRYNGTFVHRLSSGFVVQLGGYSFDPSNGTFESGGVSHIPVDAPVVNEFSSTRSNVRGTVAMAKLGGDPDSATSEWFFNLANNSANLDYQNGGFTVFGQVLGAGMDTIDAIAALDKESLSGFPELPVVDHTPGDPVSSANLVVLDQAVVAPPIPDIDVDSAINVGDVLTGDTLHGGFSIRNFGSQSLSVTGIEITGAEAGLFTLGNNCIGQINAGAGCRESLDFTPAAVSESIDATIRVFSDDPYDPVVEVPVSASVSSDADGVKDAIENLAPNGGDGNRDGIADALQLQVASLPDIHGEYITIETAAGLTLSGVVATDSPSPSTTPAADSQGQLTFSHGFLAFSVENVPVSGQATVTIHLPAGSSPNSYFKYGLTPDNALFNHWYLFGFNGNTGAELHGDRVVLHFVDGGRGDADLAANGRIVDPGGPATAATVGSAGSSGGGGCTLSGTGDRASGAGTPVDFIVLILALFGMRQRSRRHCD